MPKSNKLLYLYHLLLYHHAWLIPLTDSDSSVGTEEICKQNFYVEL